MDKEKIKEGVKLILEGVGEDTTREGLLETPDRIARMYEELFAGLHTDASEHLAKTFTLIITRWSLRKILRFILCVNIICFRFTEKHMWLMCRTVKWSASVNLPAR